MLYCSLPGPTIYCTRKYIKKPKNNQIKKKVKKQLDFFAHNYNHWSGDKDFSVHNSTELAR